MVGSGTGLEGKRKGGAGGWVVSMGPVEEPFSYSKQQRPAGAASASAVSASPAIIYSCWRPSLRYNGQVIHPLRLLARETTTAPGRQHSSSLLIAFRISASRDSRERKRERGAREGNCTEEEKETGDRQRTHVLLPELFSSSFVTLYVARDCSRPFP